MTNSLPPAETLGISPKAFWAGLVSLAVSLGATGVVAIVDYVVANPELLAGLPPVLTVGIVAVLVPLSAALAAYKASPGVVVTEGRHELD